MKLRATRGIKVRPIIDWDDYGYHSKQSTSQYLDIGNVAVEGIVTVIGVFLAKPIVLSMSEKTFVRLELKVLWHLRVVE